jgi:hypothetical protein
MSRVCEWPWRRPLVSRGRGADEWAETATEELADTVTDERVETATDGDRE